MAKRIMSLGLAALLCATTLTVAAAQDDAKKDNTKQDDGGKKALVRDDTAKDDAKKDDTAAPAEKVVRPYAEVSAEWEALDKRISDLIDTYRTAPLEARAALVEQYETAIGQSRAILPELRTAALKAYEAAPNADKKVVVTLVGLMANDVRTDQYSEALELGNLLTKNKCDEPAIDGLIGSAAYCLDDFETAGVYLKKGQVAKALSQQANGFLADLELATKSWNREQEIRAAEAAADDLPRVKFQTQKGDIVVELLENEAPQAVANFVSLVEKQFYDGLTFHRVLAGFMAQAGCPEGNGTGGPGYNIYCECGQDNHRHHFRGTLSMAHAGKDTGGSQFFLTFRRTAHLDGRHTVFGRVIEGMDVLAKIQRRDPNSQGQPEPDKIVKAEIIRKRSHEYVPTKVKE